MPQRSKKLPARQAEANFQGVWKMFGLVFLLSSLLSIFILWRQRAWVGNHQRAVVVVHQTQEEVRHPLSIVIFKPEEKIQVLRLPPEQMIETPLEYGTYTSDALVGLTQLEGLKWDYLQYALSLEYGVALDGIIWSQTAELNQVSQIRGLALRSVFNRRPSTLAFWDRMKMWLWSQRVPNYQLEVTDMARYLEEDSKKLDQTRYDRWAELYVQDVAVRGSDYSVAVHNGTNINGYAKRVSRMLGLMGYYVRAVETVQPQEQSIIWHESGTATWPAQRLKAVANVFDWKKNAEKTSDARADAVWQLGSNERELFQD